MVVLDLALAVFAIRQFQVKTLGLHLKIRRGREGCRRCGQRDEKGTDGKGLKDGERHSLIDSEEDRKKEGNLFV